MDWQIKDDKIKLTEIDLYRLRRTIEKITDIVDKIHELDNQSMWLAVDRIRILIKRVDLKRY